MILKKSAILALVFLLGVTGCRNMTWQERNVTGVAVGATIGILTADALRADSSWIIIAALAGAAIGTLVAQNYSTNECAYVRPDRRYDVRRCP